MARENDKVPDEVTGEPVVKMLGADKPTDVTVPFVALVAFVQYGTEPEDIKTCP